MIETGAALDHARRDSQLAAADIERLRRHERDLSAQVAELQIVRDNLDREVIDASRAIERAGQREAELAGEIDHERAMRATLEQAVADADTNLREARQRHDVAVATAARLLRLLIPPFVRRSGAGRATGLERVIAAATTRTGRQ